ncbi:MAG TPA: branched-chain amino acid transport system II carrier protein, partial [Pseudogracilibacillus sp.]|nr:branched-chain amino acid transport system II carrier protein [Pseudogracilibacillus sp.]
YFGTFGALILAAVIILACLTTAIGLIIANAEYFHTIIPKVPYKIFVIIFTLATFTIANFGLDNIIAFSLPVLMLLYPLAIVLIVLTFTSKLFKHAQIVYVITIALTFCVSLFDGLKSLAESLEMDNFSWMKPIIQFYDQYLPLYSEGLGWFLPALAVILLSSAVTYGLKLSER